MATTPFDINKFLKGQPAQTQSGKPIGKLKELRFAESEDIYLTAIIDDLPKIWDVTGNYLSGPETGLDLLMTVPIIFKWAVSETLEDEDPLDEKTYTKLIMP